jgi:DNA replicative helicase MCM subunit Mcm2 (Cdc46/Mcm family)
MHDRFDLLYLILDRVDEDSDRRLAQHLITLYLEDNPFTAGNDIVVRSCYLVFLSINNDM